MANIQEHLLTQNIEQKRNDLRRVCHADRAAAVHKAFANLLSSWSSSERFEVSNPRYGCAGDTLSFEVEEHVAVARCDQLHLWALKESVKGTDGQLQPAALGCVDLDEGENVIGVFTVLSRSILIVSSFPTTSRVRRVTFPSKQSRGSPPVVASVRRLGRKVTHSDFNVKDRLLVLGDGDGKISIYRLDASLLSMEGMRSIDLCLKTSLELPLQSLMFSDGVLYMVGRMGAMQSLNTRNLQTSRKHTISAKTVTKSRLFRLMDGAVLGWLEGDRASEDHLLRFIAADDMRELPQSARAGLPSFVSVDKLVCDMCGDLLFVVNSQSKEIHVVNVEATLHSDSYRIRSVTGSRATQGDVSADTGDEDGDLTAQHWLWAFYHLYEKFPVRGELYRSSPRARLKLSFVCDVVRETRGNLVDQGCEKFLGMIMEKLRLLNKPLFGMDLTLHNVTVLCSDAAKDLFSDYDKITPQTVATLIHELITFVPVQICRAQDNTLTLMTDGQPKPHEDMEGALSSADIARQLRFGLLSPLLTSWRRQCIVVTSMGKQSTGKSYFLNHLTGTSFAIAGARCTDGAWMSVRVLPSGVLLVVMDFEGLGSFERTEQEDVFLSVLNASVSMLTIFRMEMRLDREIDELFSKFQKGSQLIKKDAQLFRGKLYMSVKDVNPNDQRGVVGEFVTKFQRLLEANKENNFLTDMYAGQLDINCSPPLGTVGYYKSLSHAQLYINRQLCGIPEVGFPSGKAFLDYIRLLLAKISILDWTSLDESAIKFKIAEVTQKLPVVLRFGCISGSPSGGEVSNQSSGRDEPVQAVTLPAREELTHATTNAKIQVMVDDVCAANTAMADKWHQLDTAMGLDLFEDDAIDLGVCLTNPTTDAGSIQAASVAVRSLFHKYLELVDAVAPAGTVRVLKKSSQHRFDGFLSFVVRRRCLRVQEWCRSIFSGNAPEAWHATEQQSFGLMQSMLVRCLDTCSQCHLGCMKASSHTSSDDAVHDCTTNHVCAGRCEYCSEAGLARTMSVCSKPGGHEGRCECASGDHTCRQPCLLLLARNCGRVCAKKAGHDECDDHRCSVGLHKCGQPCAAHGCLRPCVLDVEVPHTAHQCESEHCLAKCIMEGCTRTCRSTDHFYGLAEEKIAFAIENPDLAAKDADTFDDTSGKPTIHMCDQVHACPEMCAQDGICHIDVFLKQSSKMFEGARASFQYTYQEMNGSRKKCAHKLARGQMAHADKHTCCGLEHEEQEMDGQTQGSGSLDAGSLRVRHYCDVRCPCCSYYCQKEHGHNGTHKTTHGNMRNMTFFSDDMEIDLLDRKYAAGESGMAEMCNLYCSKMGRGHAHFLECEKRRNAPCVYKGDSEDMRRHCTRTLEPKPEKEQDEVLHARFWETLGWEDPCASVQDREEFAKCAYKCDAPDHEEKEQSASYCVLPAWHLPVSQLKGASNDGFSYVSGHKFECSHVTAENKIHHVFMLDCSGSMKGGPWEKLLAAFEEYVHNRISNGSTEDLVSVVTFSHTATIVCEAQQITAMTCVKIPFRGGGTSFAVGLLAASQVLSRVAFDKYKPVLVVFSDGHPHDAHQGEQIATHILGSYGKYGLTSFAVGFGSVNLSVLEHVAQRLGGSYCHVLTGDELKTTFHSISASLGTRVGLALTKPQHEKICVICQKELACEATTLLVPCQHELHQRCYRSLVGNTTAGEVTVCPSCRQQITNPCERVEVKENQVVMFM